MWSWIAFRVVLSSVTISELDLGGPPPAHCDPHEPCGGFTITLERDCTVHGEWGDAFTRRAPAAACREVFERVERDLVPRATTDHPCGHIFDVSFTLSLEWKGRTTTTQDIDIGGCVGHAPWKAVWDALYEMHPR